MSGTRAAFTFDRDFSQTGARASLNEAALQLPVPHAEHIRLLEAARHASFTEGFETGRAQQQQEDQSRLSRALEDVARQFAQTSADMQQMAQKSHEDAVMFALLFARKLAGQLLDTLPLSAVEGAARAIFADVRGSPHVAVRVSPPLVDACKARLSTLLHESGMETKLFVFPDPDMASGDCRIEWADGGIVRSREALMRALDDALHTLMPGIAPAHDQHDLSTPA